MPEGTYILDSRALLEIGGLIGVMAGTITFLLRMVLKSKDDLLADMKTQRDFWQQAATGQVNLPEGHERPRLGD